jgi:hypothetical protein
MSRGSRRFRKWERLTRQHAWHDARQFTMDLYWGQPRPMDPYDIGVALQPAELLYRLVWLHYSTLARTNDSVDARGCLLPGTSYWRDWGWCQTLITSHRLATRLAADGCRLVSNWWSAVAGVQIDLSRDAVLLDDGAGEWRGRYAGSGVAVVGVAAVERVYGPEALHNHPGLQWLQQGDAPLRPDRLAARGRANG